MRRRGDAYRVSFIPTKARNDLIFVVGGESNRDPGLRRNDEISNEGMTTDAGFPPEGITPGGATNQPAERCAIASMLLS
ncbi:MAG TPA: hypothetical protein VJ696_12965, partial [Rhodanobacteraceae bacterium]|nr:hypothetical protein [Rhodanobacteraceae bacterium]